MDYQMVTWPMTSRDPRRCREAVRSAILATAWLLVSSTEHTISNDFREDKSRDYYQNRSSSILQKLNRVSSLIWVGSGHFHCSLRSVSALQYYIPPAADFSRAPFLFPAFPRPPTPFPFHSPLNFPSISSPPMPLLAFPLNPARRSWEHCKLPQRVRYIRIKSLPNKCSNIPILN